MKQYSVIAGQSPTLSHFYVTITNPDVVIYNTVDVIAKAFHDWTFFPWPKFPVRNKF